MQVTGRAEWLASARALLSHRPSAGRGQWEQPPLSVVSVSSGPADRIEVCRRDPTILFILGAIYNLPEVCAAYGIRGSGLRAQGSGQLPRAMWGVERDSSDVAPNDRAGALLALYLAHGMRPFQDLNGAFVLGVWDARNRQFRLMTDRLALRRVYYAAVRDGLVFGSEVKPLLAHPEVSRTVDLEGLGQFLETGHLLGDQTYYESIRWLPGGSILSYSLETSRVT